MSDAEQFLAALWCPVCQKHITEHSASKIVACIGGKQHVASESLHEMATVVQNAKASYNATHMPWTEREIAHYVKAKNPELFARYEAELMRVKAINMFIDLLDMYQLNGAQAFAKLQQEQERKLEQCPKGRGGGIRMAVACMKEIRRQQEGQVS